ncbi:MAG: 1,4-alpha-glucan branching protein GlgB [Lachnospiraceae bacterium]
MEDFEKNEKIYISKDDQYLFAEGTHYEIYNKLGAHISFENGVKGVYFAVWAPNAKRVHVIGTFNGWNEESHGLEKVGEGGIFGKFFPHIEENELYKFLIIAKDGNKYYKADPFANEAEIRPGTASRITNLSDFHWTDDEWMKNRDKKNHQKEPIAIYECHIGSWLRHGDGFYSYREFTDKIIAYLKEFQYTHIEIMGIAEYPYDGSWGYQVTGYYAPTSRYGKAKDFMYLINELHKNNIGIILDWVPAHFPKDAHGLAEFDGTCLFEHSDPRQGEHADWGTKIFNYGKYEVKNFLIANALFWIKEFHVDGLRVDAVASMLYLDYGKSDGQWVANKYGDNKNLEAIDFLKHLNSIIKMRHPSAIMIAEESTAWPKVTGDVEDGGLGFTFKWNMGWMHDFCEYMKLDPLFKKNSHHSLTFAMSYNESENYILPLSHDEVVHLKCSMVSKMPGFQSDKYANLRAGYAYMFGHCGKKLLFMGQEFGQEREWSEDNELDWFLLEKPLNKGMHSYVKELLSIYRTYPALYENDNNWYGFEWINCCDGERSTYSFLRKSETGKNNLLFVFNFTPIYRKEYMVGVPTHKKAKLLLNSDEKKYGGEGFLIKKEMTPKKKKVDGKDYSITFDLPPFSAIIFLV